MIMDIAPPGGLQKLLLDWEHAGAKFLIVERLQHELERSGIEHKNGQRSTIKRELALGAGFNSFHQNFQC
jgi:hypothetical protein